jgi:hypothetical protein
MMNNKSGMAYYLLNNNDELVVNNVTTFDKAMGYAGFPINEATRRNLYYSWKNPKQDIVEVTISISMAYLSHSRDIEINPKYHLLGLVYSNKGVYPTASSSEGYYYGMEKLPDIGWTSMSTFEKWIPSLVGHLKLYLEEHYKLWV